MPKTPEESTFFIPVGTVFKFVGNTAPAGFLICNGSTVSRTTYANLHSILQAASYPYGNGDGSTTFHLPNFNGRAPIGVGSYTDIVSGAITRNLGDSIGAEKHLLLDTQTGLVSHSHSLSGSTSANGSHSHSVPQGAYTPNANAFGQPGDTFVAGTQGWAGPQGTSGVGDHSHSISGTANSVSSLNASVAHNNMQPSLAINFIVKY